LSFSIWATSNTGTHIPPDPSRPVIKVSPDRELKRSLSASSYVFENRSADFVAIDLPPDDKKWIRVRVSSPDFDPVLFSLNANDEIQTYSDDAGSDTLDAELTLSPGKYDSVLVITTVGRSILKEDTSKPYTLHVKSYPYNPAKGALGWLEYKFTNPVTTFLSGVLLSVLVGYFFFWKTLRLKRICFEVLSDRFLIDERKAPSPALKIRTNDEPLRCASYYEIVLWHAGYLRITSDHVRRQLRLRLGNVTRILHVNTQTRTGGWLEPQVPADDDATILLSFSNLDPGDKLVLGAICEQAEPAKIVTDVEGDVSETKVQAKERVLSSTTLWLIGVFNVIFFILGPIILFDLWLNFMPGWFPRLLAFVWVPFMLIYMGFFILSRRGRRLFIGYVAAIVYDHPLHLFTKRKSGKEHGTG
jgi:hypothetical protein